MSEHTSTATSSQAHDRGAGVLMVMRTLDVPFTYVIPTLQRHERVTPLAWQEPSPAEWELAGHQRPRRNRQADGRAYYGREVRLRRARSERDYPWTVTLASPRLLGRLITAPEDVIVVVELNLAALFAVMSKVRPGRRVVALVEGDPGFLGATGSAGVKVALRRLIARFTDVIAANSSAATSYVTGRLGVDHARVVEGWWLAAPPESFTTNDHQQPAGPGPTRPPVLLTAGQLIPRKGNDLLLPAVARYLEECGPCHLRIVGDGPERRRLQRLAQDLSISEHVEFVGQVSHSTMIELVRSCDLFVFPTLYDLVGRVVVEALSVGTPVAVSSRSGAAHTLVRDGENGVVMDPQSPASIVDALRRATAPGLHDKLSAGARATAAELTPDVAAATIARAITRARDA